MPKLGLRRHLSVAQIGYGTVADGRVRVIYYFHDHRTPLYLLTVFGKGEKGNLTLPSVWGRCATGNAETVRRAERHWSC